MTTASRSRRMPSAAANMAKRYVAGMPLPVSALAVMHWVRSATKLARFNRP